MEEADKDTSSGSDMRTYYCQKCRAEHIEDRGKALWQAIADANEESNRTRDED